MAHTLTVSRSFTRTDVKYLASKVAADLRQMQRLYGKPSDSSIQDYVAELVILMVGGYLDSVEYGFRRGNDWVVAISYSVDASGLLVSDDRPGRVPVGEDISNAGWYSYLRYNRAWSSLKPEEQRRIREQLPFRRTSSPEPGAGNGYWTSDKSYSKEGVALKRGSFRSR